MKASPSNLIASVFSLGKRRDPAVEELLRSDGLVIVIQDRAAEALAPVEIPYGLSNINFCVHEALSVARPKAIKAYSDLHIPNMFSKNIDLAA